MVIIHLLEQVAAEHFAGLNGISRGVEARKNVSCILSHHLHIMADSRFGFIYQYCVSFL